MWYRYPWWPSIVCLHPSLNTFAKRKGKTELIHVQFFDDPVSRAWIKSRDLKEYLGKHNSDVPLLKDLKWNQSIEFADQAMKMPADERWTLIGELRASDDEDDIQVMDAIDVSDKSKNSTPEKSKNSTPEKSKPNESEQKSELKRKLSQKDRQNTDRKKLKKFDFKVSNDSEESDDEFKIDSEDNNTSDEEEVIEELSDESNSVSEDSYDSEPKLHSKKRSSKKKTNTKSKHSSNKSKNRKKPKIYKLSKACESSDDSDSIILGKEFDSSDDEPSPKRTNTSKLSNSTPNSSKNWLTERTHTKKLSEKKSSETPKSSFSNNKANKSILSIADDSFRTVSDFSEQNGAKDWPHFNYEFLKPEKIKDKSGKFRLMSGQLNPDYDPSTLSVSESFLNSCTPALRQWWVFKTNHFDTVLFFKMGKFYELFHMDAVIAVNELQIAYMKGELAHAGFPEKAYKRYADVLIQKGYKVARIEQTETPQMMEKRVKQTKKSTKFDKVVNREICRVSTIGSRMASVIDADMLTDRNSYLLAITENVSLYVFLIML